jgi:hypothetical protein
MDRTLSQRRLIKKVGGTFTVLREDTTKFTTNQTYRLTVNVNGSAISVFIDGVQFYSGTDASLASGSVAMYTWRNSGATFDNVVVRGFAPIAGLRSPSVGATGGPILLADAIGTDIEFALSSRKIAALEIPISVPNPVLSEIQVDTEFMPSIDQQQISLLNTFVAKGDAQ